MALAVLDQGVRAGVGQLRAQQRGVVQLLPAGGQLHLTLLGQGIADTGPQQALRRLSVILVFRKVCSGQREG